MKTIFAALIVIVSILLVGCKQGTSGHEHVAGQLLVHRDAKGNLMCPVMGTMVESEAKAVGFSDYNGKRYYFCCDGCKPSFDKDPAKYAVATTQEKQSQADVLEAKSGKYVVELWPPDDGVFAGEEIDIEFGIFDSTKMEKDGGLAGVDDVAVTAEVKMPAMQGMPSQKPHIHKEGRAGVHGMELFFPHGGSYQIDLKVTLKGSPAFNAVLTLTVKDERTTKTVTKLPYSLQVLDFPHHVDANQPVELKLKVVDEKTGKAQTAFEVVHEQTFHLLIASKDLDVFMHEHPVMAPDGTWSASVKFPKSGEYWIYGDIAPRGRGSLVVQNKVSVHGGESKTVPIVTTLGPSVDGGLAGVIKPSTEQIPIGKSVDLAVQLKDASSRKPAGDIQPWLGAAGHLVLIHQDGQTVVHSHPHESAEAADHVKRGEVTFTARFPRAGIYKAFAQFKRGGVVRTLPFAFEVK
jgi:YHS domain-containing protein